MDFRYYYITHWEKINACRKKENVKLLLQYGGILVAKTVVLRHYQNERKPYGGCRMAFFGWDSWTQNSGFRLYTADALVHLCENLIRCDASEWFFVGYANDKKGERGCVLPFYGMCVRFRCNRRVNPI